MATALITASRNAVPVLGGAGLLDLFEVRVDGVVARDLDLPGKRGEIPMGYRVGGTSIVALSLLRAPGYAEDAARGQAVAPG